MDNIQHGRFKDAPWYPKIETYVTIGGAGGIGSWTAMLLARAGFKIVVYDFDMLEAHNLGGQLFAKSMIGMTKVEALEKVVKDYCNEDITMFNEALTSESMVTCYTISAFDNMKARRETFTKWFNTFCDTTSEEYNPDAIFIDGRLTAEQMQIFCVTAATASQYLDQLFDDSEVEDAPCTLKQTSHSAAMIASHIVGFFTNHITNVVEKDVTRTVPFAWEYFIPMDLLTK